MLKFKKTVTLIILFCICGLQNLSFSQNVSTTKTLYSRVESGSVGKESFSFSMSNFNLIITDLGYNRSENYGPVKLNGSGFDGDLYYELYNPNLDADPANWRKWNNNIRSYKFIYDKKGGNPIIIVEVKLMPNNAKTIKTYYTEQGYLLLSSPKKDNSQNRTSSNFDISNILLNASSLSQITSKVITSFVRDGAKKYSNDMSYYSFNYKNESLTTVIIAYKTSNDEVLQIFFLMPKEEAVEVGRKSFISNFKEKQVDGNAVWVNVNTGLTYEAGYDGEVGIIVVK
ncbi:MAG: hypothetical protein QM727_07230 [Niabella sp.]